ncbi:uncharacterized protein LOC131856522 [Cryptomeria japonica]|uniref:uncharacterized protein LOC131856522 n=1 Tax=Cryptomeria japonica TaxID=3369 RepID=UPI0027D9F7B1|nr:uncharacterized protein LOC131856522 [Cryptomeria japonica]
MIESEEESSKTKKKGEFTRVVRKLQLGGAQQRKKEKSDPAPARRPQKERKGRAQGAAVRGRHSGGGGGTWARRGRRSAGGAAAAGVTCGVAGAAWPRPVVTAGGGGRAVAAGRRCVLNWLRPLLNTNSGRAQGAAVRGRHSGGGGGTWARRGRRSAGGAAAAGVTCGVAGAAWPRPVVTAGGGGRAVAAGRRCVLNWLRPLLNTNSKAIQLKPFFMSSDDDTSRPVGKRSEIRTKNKKDCLTPQKDPNLKFTVEAKKKKSKENYSFISSVHEVTEFEVHGENLDDEPPNIKPIDVDQLECEQDDNEEHYDEEGLSQSSKTSQLDNSHKSLP